MALKIEWHRSLPAIEPVVEEGRALEAAVRERTVFASADHVIPWYRHYAGVYGEPLVGAAREGAELVGLAPFALRRGRVGGVSVRQVDLAGFDAEAGELLVRDGRPDVVEALLVSLAAQVPVDVVCLNNLDASSSAFGAVRAAAAGLGWSVDTAPTYYATVDLAAGYDAYCASMSRNFRRNLKRHAERIQQAGRVTVEGVHFTPELERLAALTERFFALFAASWKAAGRQPQAAHHLGFYREFIQRYGARSMVDFQILTLGGRDVAVVVGFLERGVYYDVTLTHDARYEELSPGTYLLQEVLRRLPDAGARLLVSHGAHEYKRRWATAFVPVVQALLFSRRPLARLGRLLKFELAPRLRRRGAGGGG